MRKLIPDGAKRMDGIKRVSLLATIAIVLFWWTSATVSAQPATERVLIETELGSIEVELYPDKAPVTVENFLRYVEAGHYEGGSFFRTVTMENQPNNGVRIEVIQAGVHPWQDNFAFEAIPLERTGETGILHRDGAISMARGAPNSATSSFFICIGDQPELDFGGGSGTPMARGSQHLGGLLRGWKSCSRFRSLRRRDRL